MKTDTVCFIGHRNTKNTVALRERVQETIVALISNGAINFLFGDHSAFNDLCYELVTELQATYPAIRRIHIRCHYEDADDYTRHFLTAGYEESVCPKGVAYAGRAKLVERNRAMIRQSDVCIFYFDETYMPARRKCRNSDTADHQPKSGTALAFRYAKSRKKPIINCFYPGETSYSYCIGGKSVVQYTQLIPREDTTMNLSLSDIRTVAFGAEAITEQNGYFVFHRFSAKEAPVYLNTDNAFKVRATAGVKLDFYTDADTLSFDYRLLRASSRAFAFFDLYLNGVFVDSAGSDEVGDWLDGSYSRDLPNGENRVTVYFPNLYGMQVKNLRLGGGNTLRPHAHRHTMVSYGDSITQGYDARFSSCSYANRLAQKLDTAICNKAIGGDFFRPALAENAGGQAPDYVTVAYGTNDWSHHTKETVRADMAAFLDEIDTRYPQATVFVIAPIWRKDFQKETAFGRFEEMVALIEEICRKHPRFHLIKGEALLPHTDALFSDGYLHPNDPGMLLYADGLYKAIEEYI